MKIQFLNGGLANQAFQYIFTRFYELSHPGEIMYLDDSYFALNTVHNGYELEKVFGIKPHMISECFDEDVWEYFLTERATGKSIPQVLCENGIPMSMISEVGDSYKSFHNFEGKVHPIPAREFYPEILDMPGDIYYHGYWIHKNWFETYRDIFLKEFTFPEITDAKNRDYLERIESGKSVSVHIRRGDYVTLGWDLETARYREMIEKFVKKCGADWELFVFSDDIEWCKQNAAGLGFDSLKSVIYVEGNVSGKNYIDMHLMSRCKAMIMSNSAFCYLAALLNTGLQACINPTKREV